MRTRSSSETPPVFAQASSVETSHASVITRTTVSRFDVTLTSRSSRALVVKEKIRSAPPPTSEPPPHGVAGMAPSPAAKFALASPATPSPAVLSVTLVVSPHCVSVSSVHSSLQPSPLSRLPSSHSSSPSRSSFPQIPSLSGAQTVGSESSHTNPSSNAHCASQPSPLSVPPSSQSSPSSNFPLPHRGPPLPTKSMSTFPLQATAKAPAHPKARGKMNGRRGAFFLMRGIRLRRGPRQRISQVGATIPYGFQGGKAGLGPKRKDRSR